MSISELPRRITGLAWTGIVSVLLTSILFIQPIRSTLAGKQPSKARPVEIAAGIDLFTTPPGGASFDDFADSPVPHNFFGDGSDPFTGRIELQGTPLHSATWPANVIADTVIERKATATLRGPNDLNSVPITIVALSLVGTGPITVTYNGGQNAEQWDVAICLSGAEPQSEGLLALRADACGTDSGTFGSWLTVVPRLIFTRLGDGVTRVLDYGELGLPAIEFVTSRGYWSANDTGLGLAKVEAGLTIDADCDPSTPDAGPLPASGQFFIGAFRCGVDCGEGPFLVRLTQLEAENAALGLRPAGTSAIAGDEQPCDVVSVLRVARASVASTNAHDLAVTAIKPIKKIKLSDKKPSQTKKVSVSIVNHGTNTETITSGEVLSNLVQLTVESLGSCPNATAVMLPPKKLPILLKPNGKLSVSYNVTIDCANDPLVGAGHEDFRYLASVNLSALTETDEVTANDTCPRDPSGSDPGCGAKTPPGGPVLTDVSGGSGPANQAPNAVDDSANALNNTSVDINVLANDTDPDNDTLNVTSFSQPANGSVTFTNNVANFAPSFSFSGTNTFTYTISDGHGGTDTATVTVIVAAPSIVAPPLNGSAATDFGSATAFLYTGSNAVQTGVSDGVIDPMRVAVLRGKVKTNANQPLAGVTVTILNHPEFGQTLTRVDGLFDMVVNGGGLIVVKFAKTDFLPVQRQIQMPWQDYRCLEDIVMIPVDTAVTTISFGADAAQQVAQSTVQIDTDGTRQATLLFPTGTVASIVLPNGTTQAVSSLNVRITEFTVGDNGLAAMPAQLPPNSGYTYCAEYSADEAIAADATSVQFNQPVYSYLENFLNFPVGQVVPVGFYDRQKGVWMASPNGHVIKILSISGGLAVLDTDGDGLADNAGQLIALGITDAELQRLATLYAAGQTLWRIGMTHFTPGDKNVPWGLPVGAQSSNQSPNNKQPPNSCESAASSVIKAEVQTFGEDLNIVGTPYQLHYESDRVLGNKVAYTVQIPLTEATLPPNLKRVTLIVEVAGRVSNQDFPATPSQSTSFTWDGLDAYGRFIAGKNPISVHVGYVYNAVYLTPSQFDVAWAEFSGQTASVNAARKESTLWKDWTGLIGNLPSEAVGLGGWTLNVHHAYDPRERAMYMGDGHRRTTDGLETTVINTFAGGGNVPGAAIGDGGQANAAKLSSPSAVAVGPDGSLYIAEYTGQRVRRVTPDGIITTIAGSTNASPCATSTNACGDGGLATQALLNSPDGVAVANDGTVYIVDRNDNRIRKVDTNGIITTVAGTGVFGFNGDNIPATTAQLAEPEGIAVGPDGSLYIADWDNERIRKVNTLGIITTVAGTGVSGFSGDGGPALLARLAGPYRVVVTPDGTLYIVDRSNERIRRVGPDGIITTVAGAGGGDGFSGDGAPAVLAKFSSVQDIAVAPDGSFYVADKSNQRVRLVGTEGIITTVSGTGVGALSGDGGPATRARLSDPSGLALGLDGSLYVADSFNQRVRRIQSALPGFSSTDLLVSSDDGTEVYVFDNGGRHLRTVDALTQAVRYLFAYDGNGLLASVTDGDGNVTTFEHDGAGKPTGILGPFGQHTTLTANSDGYLATFNNPANEQTMLGYTADGLLTSLTNPRGNSWSIAYDSLGRLINDTDPAGGFKALNRTDSSNSFTVVISTALGRTNSSEVISLPDGGRKRIYTYPTGLQGEYDEGADASFTSRFPDGSATTSILGPDPRWGMLAPVAITNVTTTPGGLSNVVTTGRSVTLTNVADLFSISSWTETNNINGRQYVSAYAAGSQILTNTSPSGRKLIVTYDSLMRPVRQEIVGLQPIFTAYDGHGRVSSIVQGSGAQARTNTFAYNASGYLTNTTDSLDRNLTLAYDEAGRIISQTFPDSRVVGFAYDAAGNPTGFTPPGRPSHTFAFTPVNLPSLYTPPNVGAGGNSTQFAHDLDRELTLVTRSDGLTVQYDYTGSGCNCDRLNSIIQPGGTNTYTYDVVTGNLTTISAPGGIVMTYTYDGPLLLSETWSGPVTGSVSFAYDNDFRTTSQSVDSDSAALQYDTDSLLTVAGTLALTNDTETGLLLGGTLGNVADTWSYNGFAEPSDHNATSNGASLYDAQYTRDALGRIVGVTEVISGATNVFTYAYDLFGQLTNVTQNAVTVADYTYDSNNNRLTVTDTGSTLNGTYDNQDRLTQYGTVTYAYTANGELKSKTNGVQVTSYKYDPLGNLTAVTLPDGTQIQYLIDGLNRRIGKKTNGTLVQGFLYDGQLDVVAELGGTGSVVSRFVYGSRANVPEYMIKSGTTYRFITDHLGSVRLVVNTATGQIAQRMDYDAFGQVLADTAPGFQPFGFAGGLYDRDTQLVRFGARDYDAESGRWTAHDPILFNGDQANLYAYVGNDPLNAKDALGQRGTIIYVPPPKKQPPKPPQPPQPPQPPPQPPPPPKKSPPPCNRPGPPDRKLNNFQDPNQKRDFFDFSLSGGAQNVQNGANQFSGGH